MNEKKNAGLRSTIGVMSLFFFANFVLLITPAMASIAEQFQVSNATVALASTICSLANVPSSLISGAIAGKKVRYKTLAMLSAVLCLAGGLLASFAKTFTGLLVTRAVLGIGAGLGTPLPNAIIPQLYDEKKSAQLQGIGTTAMNLFGIFFQLIGGWACALSLKYLWLSHAIMIIPLVLIPFIKEPERTAEQEEEKKSVGKLPFRAYLIAVGFGIMFMAVYPFLINMSAVVAKYGHSASVAGTITSTYTIGGMIAGVVFGKVFNIFKKFTNAACLVLLGLTLLLAYFGQASLPVLFAASFLCGFGIWMMWPGTYMEFGEIMPPELVPVASGVFVASNGICGFLSSPYMAAVAKISGSDDPSMVFLFSAVICLLLAVIRAVGKINRKNA